MEILQLAWAWSELVFLTIGEQRTSIQILVANVEVSILGPCPVSLDKVHKTTPLLVQVFDLLLKNDLIFLIVKRVVLAHLFLRYDELTWMQISITCQHCFIMHKVAIHMVSIHIAVLRWQSLMHRTLLRSTILVAD